MSTYRRREEEPEKPKLGATCMSLVYVLIVGAVAFFLAGLVMAQVNLYEVLGLYGTEVPVINASGEDIPKWALQLVLGILIFFLLQPFAVIGLALLGRRKKEDEFGASPQNPWQS